MNSSRVLALAQLLRLPNVFTAFADILMATLATGVMPAEPVTVALLLLSSGSLYLGGMVFNDYFDRHADAQSQAFRPIPSGRVSSRFALLLGIVLLSVGGLAAWAISNFSINLDLTQSPVSVALGLIVAILLYDRILKRTPIGPVGMGLCRFLNVLLGLSPSFAAIPPEQIVHLAGIIGLYIVGVTWFARTEEATSERRSLKLAAGVMALALVLAVVYPWHLKPGSTPIYFPYLLVAFGVHLGLAIVRAIKSPTPRNVQAAVKRSILGLVLLDAILATMFVGWPGLLIVLLLLPARWLGKWVYST